MENARIVIFEDHAEIREMARVIIGLTTHQIVAEAETRADAEEIIERLSDPQDSLQADAIIVDGNLKDGPGFGEDGRYLASLSRLHNLSASIIRFSNDKADPHPDFDIDTDKDLFKAIEFIDELPDDGPSAHERP